jgi:hypothetical protein
MDWIALEGLPPWDGRYPLDPGVEFSTREWGWIKRLTGYLPLTVDEAFQGGDAELYAVLALIAMHRAGKVDAKGVPDLWERLQDAPLWAKIRFESDDQPEPLEADAGPPPVSSPASEPSSGEESTTSSETSPSPVNGSGTPDSAISVYDPATWQT